MHNHCSSVTSKQYRQYLQALEVSAAGHHNTDYPVLYTTVQMTIYGGYVALGDKTTPWYGRTQKKRHVGHQQALNRRSFDRAAGAIKPNLTVTNIRVFQRPHSTLLLNYKMLNIRA